MDRDQVVLLLAKASAAFPNKAPDFKKNKQIFEIWVERLAPMDPQLALANLNNHIDTSNFFPDIADIIRRHDPEQFTDYDQLRRETELYLQQREERETKAIACPPELSRKHLMSGGESSDV